MATPNPRRRFRSGHTQIVGIPPHGLSQALLETNRRFPAEGSTRERRIEELPINLALRLTQDARAQIPAIALTAYTRAEDAELSAQAGYGWHLKKPATAEQLVQAVAEAARR